ncbi:hypothetical protein Taro_042251, partial [Colocasia esculenta]|nr:hypothetical protein [Colocasia esculenta]
MKSERYTNEYLAMEDVDVVDKRSVDGEDHVEKEAIPATGSIANGDLSVQPGSSPNPYIRSLNKGIRRSPRPTNGRRSAASVHAETSKLSTDDSVDAPVGRGTSGVQKAQNGTTMKSIEQMLAENSPISRHGRGRKVAASSSIMVAFYMEEEAFRILGGGKVLVDEEF